jgi:hypothetical protein
MRQASLFVKWRSHNQTLVWREGVSSEIIARWDVLVMAAEYLCPLCDRVSVYFSSVDFDLPIPIE